MNDISVWGILWMLFIGPDPGSGGELLDVVRPVISAIAEFFTQPFGAVGAVCIMTAVTIFNSKSLRDRLRLSEAGIGYLFNGFNLLGGCCLFINAVIRDEPVWLVLEVYFVAVALKGLAQTARTRPQSAW